MVADEASIALERTNGMIATLGIVVHGAGAAIMTKPGGAHFNKLIRQITGD